MMIIDFHTHCFPDAIAERALATLSDKASIPFFHKGTAQALDTYERAGGCDGYVVMPIATNPRQTASVNRFVGQIRDTSRHVYAFGSVHPDNADYKEQLNHIKELGLDGIKLHPEYQDFHVNDERVFPIYDEIFRLGFPLLFHAGEDEGFQPPWHSEPAKIAEVAARYPEAVIIAAHMGGYNMWREAGERLAVLPNVFADVSFSAGRMPVAEFEEACAMWPSERLLFGTDSPWHTIPESIEAVERLKRPEREKKWIFGGNALRVLSANVTG